MCAYKITELRQTMMVKKQHVLFALVLHLSISVVSNQKKIDIILLSAKTFISGFAAGVIEKT